MPPDETTGVTDHRKRPRRRGKDLDTAIFQAVLAELAERGYAKLTMERVAERARTGKASLYRRWPTRMELVMDAVYHQLPDPSSIPDTGSLRGDLLAVLREIAELLAGPAGEALRGVLSDALHDPARTAEMRQHSQGAGRRRMQEITRRAAERGEIDATEITPRRLEAGQALLRNHFLFNGVPIPDEVIVEIVDDVLIPLFNRPANRP
ncbi:TetR/AcrR family transcriptional regulator [Saccharopolyspora phatthalungensis]|uniref:AcrR family transcriptional regulator n=1 Tax=Saccharopolyspora phatthalungensis TaxID=664693 RepID=A0A840QA87_9PSEU|nr:TetR/AcrR family transcriptional regulator [Saccharopolyspora phatthalungensis]MBB5157694.1 AcrR family transcriptional regulator [Saccharopolyspora phatthalungensis]